jgi:hypothetical protein
MSDELRLWSALCTEPNFFIDKTLQPCSSKRKHTCLAVVARHCQHKATDI